MRVPPSQYMVTVRTRFFVGRLVERLRILVAERLLPHLRLRFLGVVVGSASTVRTVVVCFGFALAAAPLGSAMTRATAPSAAEVRTRCDIRIGSFPVNRVASVPGAGSAA